ncbi:hypothetical protein [Ruegeria sp. EL01]|uniref:hypothetical protein n=1 Tax=Ruegeria sp. EL01 TaxID=2107578 RepID=UPI000EA81756|nr:hypothetical protein [Ruegeria sp. EL01]
MKLCLTRALLVASAAISMSVFSAQRVVAYPVDCAILICLSGGWPASAECAHARAVFIRRITPWPIEPPLQIWNCPMGAAMNTNTVTDAPRRQIASDLATPTFGQSSAGHASGMASLLPASFSDSQNEAPPVIRQLAQDISDANGSADIDISGPEFDYVRSIKVWNVMSYSHRKAGRSEECREAANITLGTYGMQGDFHWERVSPAPVPRWVIPSRTCTPASSTRAVGIEWTDYAGNHGFEVVNY